MRAKPALHQWLAFQTSGKFGKVCSTEGRSSRGGWGLQGEGAALTFRGRPCMPANGRGRAGWGGPVVGKRDGGAQTPLRKCFFLLSLCTHSVPSLSPTCPHCLKPPFAPYPSGFQGFAPACPHVPTGSDAQNAKRPARGRLPGTGPGQWADITTPLLGPKL